jgi:N-acetylneuraminic acid mutarotase
VFLNDLVLIDVGSFSTTVVNAHESYLPTPVANGSLSVVGNKLFVFGGTDAKGNCFNDIRYVYGRFQYSSVNDSAVAYLSDRSMSGHISMHMILVLEKVPLAIIVSRY